MTKVPSQEILLARISKLEKQLAEQEAASDKRISDLKEWNRDRDGKLYRAKELLGARHADLTPAERKLWENL